MKPVWNQAPAAHFFTGRPFSNRVINANTAESGTKWILPPQVTGTHTHTPNLTHLHTETHSPASWYMFSVANYTSKFVSFLIGF